MFIWPESEYSSLCMTHSDTFLCCALLNVRLNLLTCVAAVSGWSSLNADQTEPTSGAAVRFIKLIRAAICVNGANALNQEN